MLYFDKSETYRVFHPSSSYAGSSVFCICSLAINEDNMRSELPMSTILVRILTSFYFIISSIILWKVCGTSSGDIYILPIDDEIRPEEKWVGAHVHVSLSPISAVKVALKIKIFFKVHCVCLWKWNSGRMLGVCFIRALLMEPSE